MNNEEIETLQIDDKSSLEEYEILELDDEVKKAVDEVLDSAFPAEKKKETNNKVFEDVDNKKLSTYTPSIKNFNIKNEKTHKIIKKVMVYSIIFILFTFEFFLNKAGDTLTDIRVYASDNKPIMIMKNNKYGFIDYTGEVLVNPKYSYAEEYINGYAIVRDASNLPLVIDKAGKEVIKTGEYFSMSRAGNNIIVSKATKDGLKYGILRSDLKQMVDFKYDVISYTNGVYTYSKGKYVGLFNSKYKEVYNFKLNDIDSRDVFVAPSITDNDSFNYGVVTINKSSIIINLNSGKVVTKPTLNTITPDKNNVFYETKDDNTKEYYYIYNNKVVIDSIDYNTFEMPSLTAGVLKAFKKDYSYEVLLGKTGAAFEDLAVSDTYFGDDVFIYKTYNYDDNSIVYKFIKNGEEIAIIDDVKGFKSGFSNGYAIVINSDNTYSYIDEDGEYLNDEHYTFAAPFDKYGDAIVKKGNKYGVINKKNKMVLDCEYSYIKSASSTYKINTMSDSKTVFYAAKKDNYYKLYDKNGKNVTNLNYTSVLFDDNYGFVKVRTDADYKLLISSTLNTINLSGTSKYETYDNHVIINNNYYNLKGKIIYISKSN